MTQKKLRSRVTKVIRKATGLPLPVAAAVAKMFVRRDFATAATTPTRAAAEAAVQFKVEGYYADDGEPFGEYFVSGPRGRATESECLRAARPSRPAAT